MPAIFWWIQDSRLRSFFFPKNVDFFEKTKFLFSLKNQSGEGISFKYAIFADIGFVLSRINSLSRGYLVGGLPRAASFDNFNFLSEFCLPMGIIFRVKRARDDEF